MDQDKINILRIFQLDGTPVSCKDYGSGHVNVTFLVVTDTGRRYILQKINHHAFRNVQALSENIAAVTDFLRSKSSDPRSVMSLIRTKDGAPHTRYGDEYWRVYDYVDGDDLPSAAGDGRGFLSSRRRFRYVCAAALRLSGGKAARDHPEFSQHARSLPPFPRGDRARRGGPRRGRSAGDRFCSCKGSGDVHAPELSFCRRDPAPRCAQRHEAQQRPSGREDTKGALRCRSGHRDARAQASLISATAIRYGASTAAEDERDLSKVEMSLERFRVFTRGYVRACPNLTARELELLPLGAKTITLECGMRFLTDHIDGDLYFAVHREGQNLDRARAQFRLAADMEKKWDDMRRIVAEETKA